MRDLEAQHIGFLGEKIADPAKRERFGGFQKSYYETFYAERFLPGRTVAGEVK
jgi:hypothetical protein